MARQTWAALAALYPDNTAGAISPADLRAGLIDTMRPHVTSSAPDASDDETLGFDVGHAWIDTSTSPSSVYECVDASTGEAVWVRRYPQDASDGPAADGVSYDNTTSGLTAEDVQAAIDEVVAGLGTAAAADTGDFATAAQGGLADTAVQPGDDADTLGSGDATDGWVLTADGAGGAAWEAPSGGGGGSADEFTDLTDTPANYTSAAGQYVRVNSTPDGLEFHQLVQGFEKLRLVDESTYAGLTPDEDTIYFIEEDAP